MARTTTRVRSGLVGLLFVLACISITLSTVAVWAHQTVLVTDRFVAVTSRVVAEPAVQQAAADRLASQIVTAADVQGRIAGILPEKQAVLAVPITSAVEDFLDKRLATFFATDRAQSIMETAIRFTHERLVRLLRNDSDIVSVEGTTATIDLLPIAVEGLRQLQTAGILPATVTLPDVTDPAGREAAIAALASKLGRPIPADFALVPIADATRLANAQQAVHLFDVLTVGLLVLSVLLVVATVLLSGRRLRMVGLLALGVVVSLVIARLLVRAALQGLIGSLAAGNAAAMESMLTDLLSDLAGWSWILVILGIIVAVLAVLAGRPSWLPSGGENASTWAGAHRDGLAWAVGIAVTTVVVWIAMSPDLAILVAIGLSVVAMAVGRRRGSGSGDEASGDTTSGEGASAAA